MKRNQIFQGITLVFATLCFASITTADVVDDFDGYTGTLDSSNGWNAKWDGGDATQRNLLSSVSGIGVGGSNAGSLDALTAKHSYNAVNQTGVSVAAGVGNTMTLSSQFQVSLAGNTPAQNLGFFGLHITEDPQWWNNSKDSNVDFQIARRGNANQQVFGVTSTTGNGGLPNSNSSGIEGWNNINQFGLPGGANPSGTSDWFTMEITLIDNGTTYDAEMRLYRPDGSLANVDQDVNGNPLTVLAMPTVIASGATVYGGYNNGWNNHETNGVRSTIDQYSGVNAISVDNFSFVTAVPEPASAGLVGIALLGFAAIRRRS